MAPNSPPGYSGILDQSGNRLLLRGVYGEVDGCFDLVEVFQKLSKGAG